MTKISFLLLYVTVFLLTGSEGLKVTISNNGPAVRGANVTFTATVIGYVDESLRFRYWDDAQPENRQQFLLSSNVSQWVVEYPREQYEAGQYTVTVELSRWYGIWFPVSYAKTIFQLTDKLNGDLVLNQNNKERPNNFVAVNQIVEHVVRIPLNELNLLNVNTSSVVAYWFIDCSFIYMTTDFKLNYTYTDLMGNHLIEVLVVGNTEPLPPITTTSAITSTSTTTTTTTTITPTTTNTTTTSTTTLKPHLDSTTTKILPNITGNTTDSKLHITKRAVNNDKNSLNEFICNRSGIVPLDESYIYGHYKQAISVREPVGSVNITGLNWLQHGDLMNLQVKYTGSPPFDYCAVYKEGEYNITGNETCRDGFKTMSNQFPLVHYFSNSEQHTVIVIVENVMLKQVARATINIYKVTPHAQLSVIVVPVVFCLLAVILVVFGVAYYIQHRARHTVEVADFDFGQQANLDYKSFVERLRDSFDIHFAKPEDTEVLTGSSNGYDSMT